MSTEHIQYINLTAANAAINTKDIDINFSGWKKIYINGRHRWLNESTTPRSIYGFRLGLRKREQIAERIKSENDGLLIHRANCDGFNHDWKEEYYGHRCLRCDLFYALGHAPWDDNDDDFSDCEYCGEWNRCTCFD